MTIPPATVIALRDVEAEIERSLEWVKREGFIVDYAVIQRGAGGLAAVVESSTALHALLFVRQKLNDLDALVEPQQESVAFEQENVAPSVFETMLTALKETLAYWECTGFAECDEGCDCVVESVRDAIAKAEVKAARVKPPPQEQQTEAIRHALAAMLVTLRDNAALEAQQAATQRLQPGAVVAYATIADELTALIEVLHLQPARDVPLHGSNTYRETHRRAEAELGAILAAHRTPPTQEPRKS